MLDPQNIPWVFREEVPSFYIQASSVDRRLLNGVDLKGRDLLNVGCGAYIFDDVYFAMCGANVTGIDYNRKAIERAGKKLMSAEEKKLIGDMNIKVEIGDGRNLRFEDDSFDIVTSFSAIEHMPSATDRSQAVREMVRVLKPGGLIILTGPNFWNLPTTVLSKLLFKRINEFEHRYTPGELKRLLTSAGLMVEMFDAETVYTIDELFIERKVPFLKPIPLVFFRPLAFLLRVFNAVPLFKKLGMRIGYRAKKAGSP